MSPSSARPLSPSRAAPAQARLRAPLLWLLVPLVAGYTLAFHLPRPFTGWLLIPSLGLALTGIAAQVRGQRWSTWASAAAVALAAPAWFHGLRDHPELSEREPPREASVRVEVTSVLAGSLEDNRAAGFGMVVEAQPHLRRLLGRRVFFNAERTPAGLEWIPSMEVGLRGVLRALPSNPDPGGFETYLVSSGAVYRLERSRVEGPPLPPRAWRRFLHTTLHRMEGVLALGLDDRPERRALYAALKLGAKADLSEEERTTYQRTGTLHLFAISGMNIGLIAAASYFLFRLLHLPVPAATVGGVLVSGFFVLATGTTPSAVRALIMVASMCLARLCWTATNPLALWTVPALAVLLLDPGALLSPGFQLSYAVVLGLVLYASPLTGWLRSKPPLARGARLTAPTRLGTLAHQTLRFAVEGLVVSGTALLSSLPTSLASFGAVSPGALLANLVLVPLASLVVLVGLLSLVLGLGGFTVGSIACNRLAVLALDAMDCVAHLVAAIPGVQWSGTWRWSAAGTVCAILVLGGMVAGAQRQWKPASWFLLPPLVALLLLTCANLTPG